MTSLPTCKLYLDVVSPYANVCLRALRLWNPFPGQQLKVVPVLLGGVFQATKNIAPPEIKAKFKYNAHDFNRTAKLWGVSDFRLPPKFPFSTVAPMRLVAAAQALEEGGELWVFCFVLFCFWFLFFGFFWFWSLTHRSFHTPVS
jgi:2-hydroxychromene-2-carboxylate isomerase